MGVNETNGFLTILSILSCGLLVTIAITSHYCFRVSSFYYEEDDELIGQNTQKDQASQASPASPANRLPNESGANSGNGTDNDSGTDGDTRDVDNGMTPRTAAMTVESMDEARISGQSNGHVNKGDPTLSGYLQHMCLDFRDCCLGLFSLSLDVIYSTDVGMSINAANRHRYPQWTVRTSNYFIGFSVSLFVIIIMYSVIWDQDMLSNSDNIYYNKENNYTSVPWYLYISWYILILFSFWCLFRWTQFVISKYHGMLCFIFEVFYEVNHGYWRYYVMTRDFRKFDKVRALSNPKQKEEKQKHRENDNNDDGNDGNNDDPRAFRLPTKANVFGNLSAMTSSEEPEMRLGSSIQNSIDFERAPTADVDGNHHALSSSGDVSQYHDDAGSGQLGSSQEKKAVTSQGVQGAKGEIEMGTIENKEETKNEKENENESNEKEKKKSKFKGVGRVRIATDADEVIHQLFDVGEENETLARENHDIQSLLPYKPLWYVMMRDKYHIYYYNTLISNLIGDWPYYNQYKLYGHVLVLSLLIYFSFNTWLVTESNNYGIFSIWIGYGLALIANMLHNWEDMPYDECDYDARRALPTTMYKISAEIEFAQGYMQLFEMINVFFCVLFWGCGVFYQIVVLLEDIWNNSEATDSFENSEYYIRATGNEIENPYYLFRINKFNKFLIFSMLLFVLAYSLMLGFFYFVSVLVLPRVAFNNMNRYIDEIQFSNQEKEVSRRKTEDIIVGNELEDDENENENGKKNGATLDDDGNEKGDKNVSDFVDPMSSLGVPAQGKRLRKYTTVRNILSKEDFQWSRKDGADIAGAVVNQSSDKKENDKKESDGNEEFGHELQGSQMKIMVSELGDENGNSTEAAQARKQLSYEDEPLVRQYNANLDYKDIIKSSHSITDISDTFGEAIRMEIAKAKKMRSIQIVDDENDDNDDNDDDGKDDNKINEMPNLNSTKVVGSIELIGFEKEYKEELHKSKSTQDVSKMKELRLKINNEKKRRRILWMLNSNLSLIHMLSWPNRFDAFETCVDFSIKGHCLDHILAFIEMVQFRTFVIKMEKHRYGRKKYAEKDFTGKYDAKWDYWEWPGLKFPNKVPKSYIVFHDYTKEINKKMRKRTITKENIMTVPRGANSVDPAYISSSSLGLEEQLMASEKQIGSADAAELTNLLKGNEDDIVTTQPKLGAKHDSIAASGNDGNDGNDGTARGGGSGNKSNSYEEFKHDTRNASGGLLMTPEKQSQEEESGIKIKSDNEQFQEYLYKAYQIFLKYHKLIYSIHRYSKATPYRENDETLNKYVYYRLRKLFKNETRVLLCDVKKATINFQDIKSTDDLGRNSKLEWNRSNIYSMFDLTCLLIVQDLQDKIWIEFEHSYGYDQFQHDWNLEISRRQKKLRNKLDQLENKNDKPKQAHLSIN